MRPDAGQERATGKSVMVLLYSQLPGEKQQPLRGKYQGQSLGGGRKGNRGQIPYCGFCGKAGQEGLELITLNNFKCLWGRGAVPDGLVPRYIVAQSVRAS